MDREGFARILQLALVNAMREFRQVSIESPYAFAILKGQCGNFLGYAIATEEGLRRVAEKYANLGYRYQGRKGEQFDNVEQLVRWLRWANPDDGWQYGEFPGDSGVAEQLAGLVEQGAFGEGADELEQFCTQVLAALKSDSAWLGLISGDDVVVGVTAGGDPRDFVRTAILANAGETARRLVMEQRRGEELSNKIPPPRSKPA